MTWPLYPVPRPEALAANQWCGPDGYMRELGRADRYHLDPEAVRAWRRAQVHGKASTARARPAPTERALRGTAGAYVWRAVWAAARHKANAIRQERSPEARFSMQANLASFLRWQVRELLTNGNRPEAKSAGTELSNLLFLALIEPEALHGAEYAWTPREYVAAMSAALGVQHPLDDGTALARHGARLEGFL
jgi:hypothetical protein